MIKRIFHRHINRNFSIATIWIKGGSNKDSFTKKGLNNILCSTLVRECEGFENLQLADHIESYGAELNHEVFEDGISISIKYISISFSLY